MRFTLAAFTCALAVANAAGPFAKTDVAKRDAEAELTPFANTDIEKRDAEAELVHLEARTAIEEWAAGIQTAMYAVLYAAGLAQFLAVTIKNQSDQNSCAVVSGVRCSLLPIDPLANTDICPDSRRRDLHVQGLYKRYQLR